MPRIRCHYPDCVFLDNGYCGTTTVEVDPDEGCITYTHAEEMTVETEWDEEEYEDLWGEDEVLYDDEEVEEYWDHDL